MSNSSQDGKSERRRRYEVTERIDAQGEVVTPLAEAELDGIVTALRRDKVDAVAVCLLFSFLNDRHERLVGDYLLRELPAIR